MPSRSRSCTPSSFMLTACSTPGHFPCQLPVVTDLSNWATPAAAYANQEVVAGKHTVTLTACQSSLLGLP